MATESVETENPIIETTETNEQDQQALELAQINQFIQEKLDRLKIKSELKNKNQNADSLRLDENYLKKLDSSIKKVTSFIKRLKTLTENQKDTLSKEMLQLNLTKYLSEVAAAFTEAKLKMNDINCALHLCSLMHQNYAEFSSSLFEQWGKLLNLKRDEKVANPSKLRVDLRFFAELITIGVLPEKESLSLLGNQLTVLTTFDKEHANISIISSFCKHCGEDFADLIPAKFEKLALKFDLQIPRNTIYSVDRQKAVKCLFKEYFKSLVQHLLNDHKEIQKIERQNKKTYQTKGELNAEKKEKYDQALLAYKKLVENTEALAELLGEVMPELPADEFNKKDEDTINIDIYTPGKNDDFDSTTSPWEDEETRQFYECLPDLKVLVPGILYKDSEKAGKQADASSTATSSDQSSKPAAEETKESTEVATVDIAVEMEQIEKELQELESQSAAAELNPVGDEAIPEVDSVAQAVVDIPDEEVPTPASATGQTSSNTNALANANMKALMESFINQLPNCVNRELIDKAAKEFCLTLNTKLNRKRLVNALFQVQRTRLDLLPFYSRFVAILNPVMPEVGNDLSNLLLNDFRFHIRKKDQINIESKIKSARFIGEMVKFKMFSKSEAINCLKSLLADFKHHNIEMFCNLLDVCGRYLYRNQETHQKLKLLLEILMRKKQATSMDSRYIIMIENVFYYCNPPENKQIEKKARIPLHEYIQKILYKDLNKLCVEKILRQMRKLNWKDEELRKFALRCLIAVWNVRYNSIHCMANLVSGLALYYEEIGVQVVDGVIEDIRIGLEVNQPKYNQRRVSMVKYLGELYNYRMIESAIIFKTLYTLITFGIGSEEPANQDSLDPVDSYFRVRLICILLDTCGQYFDRGSTKKKLDCFLVYFQRYYYYKKETCVVDDLTKPFDPMDVEFVFTETIATLRPGLKFPKTYKEACEAVEKMESEFKEQLTKSAPHLVKEVIDKGAIQGEDGLEPINEDEENDVYGNNESGDVGDEEDEYSYHNNDRFDQDDEDEDEDSYNRNDSKYKYSNMDGEDVNDDERNQRFDSINHEQYNTDNSDKEEITRVIQPRKQEISKEDDEFMKAFDSLVTENIAQRTKETIKMPVVDISVPMVSKKKITNQANPETETSSYQLGELKGLNLNYKTPEATSTDTSAATNKNKGFNFVVMIKKGNKTQYHNMEVPVTSEFANQFKAREEAEKAEKEKLKQLTLNINERMEQEEFQAEMMQRTYSQNTNRDRHQKYNHPKGAPDADLIFGSSSTNSNTSMANSSSSSNINKYNRL